jgi:hypothetical protein
MQAEHRLRRLKPAAAGLRLAKTGGKTAGATSWS